MWKDVITGKVLMEASFCVDLYTELLKVKETNCQCRIYDCLIFNKSVLDKYRLHWRDQENVNFEQDEYQIEFSRYPKFTKITKFRDFQYKLLLG